MLGHSEIQCIKNWVHKFRLKKGACRSLHRAGVVQVCSARGQMEIHQKPVGLVLAKAVAISRTRADAKWQQRISSSHATWSVIGCLSDKLESESNRDRAGES